MTINRIQPVSSLSDETTCLQESGFAAFERQPQTCSMMDKPPQYEVRLVAECADPPGILAGCSPPFLQAKC
jgi:hypothetical protein